MLTQALMYTAINVYENKTEITENETSIEVLKQSRYTYDTELHKAF